MQAGNYKTQRSLTYFIKNWYVTRQTMQSITSGVRPYRPQTISATAISATARRYRPQLKTISATRKIDIGHNHIGQNHIGHKIYGEFIWRHRVDTSLFRVGPGRIVNLNVKPRIRPIGQKESYVSRYREDEWQIF